jgi:tetratricopeptide (TPR) repeat protein
VLSRALVTIVLMGALPASSQALARPSGLVPLRPLTAGGADQFFGQLHPDGRRLVFASNTNGTVELFTQTLGSGAPELLHDEQGDVSQPRLSPDGASLLYLSYRNDAFGDACVLELATKQRRCLPLEGAVLHAFWFAGSDFIGVVRRLELGGTHQLLKLPSRASRPDEAEVVREGFFSSPVASPDGRWLAFVELAVGSDGGTPALLRASRGLVFLSLADGARVVFEPLLPGSSAFPAFSKDGRHLYFTQFPDDSNADGVTDGNDNGVLVRVPFEGARAAPAQGEDVEVLTSKRSNCQYPMPAADRLLATCNRRGFLQVVSLPLEGQVPPQFDAARLDDEASAARHRFERLLLQERRLERETDLPRRVELERRLAMSTLELGAFDSAEFDLGLMQRDAGVGSDEATWAKVATELVRHRRDEGRLGFGKLSDEFIASERARLARLEGYDAHARPTVRRLSRLVRAEVLRVLGQKSEALALFDALDLEAETDPDVVLLWGRLAERLLRETGDREAWARANLRVSRHPALGERERLIHARRFIDALTAGRGKAARLRALAAAEGLTQPGSEARLLLEVERALDEVEPSAQATAVATLEALWQRAPSFEQHRMVAMTIIERAAHDDLQVVLDVFAQRWLDDVPQAHPERKYAEALYAEVQLERAYWFLQQQRHRDAAALFLSIARKTRSLEAVSGFVEASARGGVAGSELTATLAAALGQTPGVMAFAEAVVLGRTLPSLDGDDFTRTLSQARAALRASEDALARSPEFHHLLGFLAHEDFHHGGARAAALEAHGRYHLALDLAPDVYRRRASLLLELGLLQAALGNHRIAVKHYEERARLPFVRPAEQAAFHLAYARSLLHADALDAAMAEAREGLAFVTATPGLAPFLPLALERAMVTHLVAGQPKAAIGYGEQLLPLVPPSVAAQVKPRLALASAHLAAKEPARAKQRLGEARAALASSVELHDATALAAGPTHLGRDDLRALVAGLEAVTFRALGDLPARQRALAERREVLATRQQLAPRDETLHELARLAHHQAWTAARAGRWSEARRFLEQGLADDEAWRAHTGTRLDAVSTALVELCAEVQFVEVTACPLDPSNLTRRLREGLQVAASMKTQTAQSVRTRWPELLARLLSGPRSSEPAREGAPRAR